MKAAILTIGDEILIGQILDTNSQWISQKLNFWGLDVQLKQSIPDDEVFIQKTLSYLAENFQVVIVTGGLGPTKDDVTKKAICSFFNCELYRDERVLNHIKEQFRLKGRDLLPANQAQADVPSAAEVLFNPLGTAPGLKLQHSSCHFFFLPGVPIEMKYLMDNEVSEHLKSLNSHQMVRHFHVLTAGMPESILAKKIADLEDSLPESIHFSYLPSYSTIRLRFSYISKSEEEDHENYRIVLQCIESIKKRIGIHFIVDDDITLEEAIIRKLQVNSKTLATAESCTGGNVGHLITEKPGASQVYQGGHIVYTNEMKKEFLDVSEKSLSQYSAVSKEVAEEMVKGLVKNLKVDFAVATTGYVGPSEGLSNSDVGKVFIGVGSKDQVWVEEKKYAKTREMNIELASHDALFLLWKLLQHEVVGLTTDEFNFA